MAIAATSGLISSIDYQSLIRQLLEVRKVPVNQLNSDKKTLGSLSKAYETLSTKVNDLRTAAAALKGATGFSVFTAGVTDEGILGATASSTASPGTYEITVNSIARAHRIAADGVASDTSTIAAGPGSFSFQIGTGPVQTVAVDDTTTLAGLRDAINALGAGVKATIANDGSGATPYRLILSSETVGTAGAVNITQNDTSLAFSTTLSAATDASVTMDGLTYTRSSNTITDIVPGATLSLKSADAAKTVTLTVERDTASIEKKITEFVDKYNLIVGYIKANNRYDSETKAKGHFFGDSVARSVWGDLRRLMSQTVAGLPEGMSRLVHAGISTDSGGALKVDSAKLTEALKTDFDGVVNLFSDNGTTKGFGSLVHELTTAMTDGADGRIPGRKRGVDKNIRAVEETIRRKEAEIDEYESQLIAQFTALEKMLAGLKQQSSYLAGLMGVSQ